MTDLNVNFEGEKFMPEKEITEKEFMDMLNKLGYYINSKENKEERSSLSKIDAIKLIIDTLGLTKVAELKDIYKADFNDVNLVKNDDVGYVALAKALGIIEGDHVGNLTPDKKVTRAEAVVMALKLVGLNINR